MRGNDRTHWCIQSRRGHGSGSSRREKKKCNSPPVQYLEQEERASRTGQESGVEVSTDKHMGGTGPESEREKGDHSHHLVLITCYRKQIVEISRQM